jgi:hypothetical protein
MNYRGIINGAWDSEALKLAQDKRKLPLYAVQLKAFVLRRGLERRSINCTLKNI